MNVKTNNFVNKRGRTECFTRLDQVGLPTARSAAEFGWKLELGGRIQARGHLHSGRGFHASVTARFQAPISNPAFGIRNARKSLKTLDSDPF
jgi:hypothetical protein